MTKHKSFDDLAKEGQELFEQRAEEGRKFFDNRDKVGKESFEDNNIIVIDSRSISTCPFNCVTFFGVVAKVNSGYCRNLCNKRNYTVKAPGDYYVACNKKWKLRKV